MNSVELDIVRSVATAVRYWAEGQAEGTYKEGDLNGMCAIASAELFKQLKDKGFNPELHCWICPMDEQTAHVFLVVNDHVVDVTATQFTRLRDKIIYIEHKREAEQWDWYQSQTVFATPADLARWQKKTKWPADQRVQVK